MGGLDVAFNNLSWRVGGARVSNTDKNLYI